MSGAGSPGRRARPRRLSQTAPRPAAFAPATSALGSSPTCQASPGATPPSRSSASRNARTSGFATPTSLEITIASNHGAIASAVSLSRCVSEAPLVTRASEIRARRAAATRTCTSSNSLSSWRLNSRWVVAARLATDSSLHPHAASARRQTSRVSDAPPSCPNVHAASASAQVPLQAAPFASEMCTASSSGRAAASQAQVRATARATQPPSSRVSSRSRQSARAGLTERW